MFVLFACSTGILVCFDIMLFGDSVKWLCQGTEGWSIKRILLKLTVLISTTSSYLAPRYNSNCQQQIMPKAKCAFLSLLESICRRQTLALHHGERACHRLSDSWMKISDSEHAKLFDYYQTHRLPSCLVTRRQVLGQGVLVTAVDTARIGSYTI